MPIDLGGYVDVAERITLFREKHPEGCLRPAYPSEPYKVETIGEQTFIVYVAAAYRSPADDRPGIGVAWEPFPGKTNFTRDSELQNAETSAWGRAIVAVLAADTKHGIASRQEVESRNGAPPNRKREVVDQLNALKLSTAGTLEELEARLAEHQSSAADAPSSPADSDRPRTTHPTESEEGGGTTHPAVDPAPLNLPEPVVDVQLPPLAEDEKRLLTERCADCDSERADKILGVGDRVICRDRKGCEERAAKLEEPFA